MGPRGAAGGDRPRLSDQRPCCEPPMDIGSALDNTWPIGCSGSSRGVSDAGRSGSTGRGRPGQRPAAPPRPGRGGYTPAGRQVCVLWRPRRTPGLSAYASVPLTHRSAEVRVRRPRRRCSHQASRCLRRCRRRCPGSLLYTLQGYNIEDMRAWEMADARMHRDQDQARLSTSDGSALVP
jgi:hypothetical protein